MKLNKQQQQQWNTVTNVFTVVSRISPDAEVVKAEMSSFISDFETATNNEFKVKIRMLPVPTIDMIDCSRDSLKLIRDADGTMTLRVRVHGVGFSSTVAYKDSYAHSNVAVIDALRELADSLEKLPCEMIAQTDSQDIYQLIGVSRPAASEEDAPGEAEAVQKPEAESAPVDENDYPIQLESVGEKEAE